MSSVGDRVVDGQVVVVLGSVVISRGDCWWGSWCFQGDFHGCGSQCSCFGGWWFHVGSQVGHSRGDVGCGDGLVFGKQSCQHLGCLVSFCFVFMVCFSVCFSFFLSYI